MLGFVNIYKPSNVSSNHVVVALKKKFNIKKVGHFGTLDPMACGVLPIAIGKATRLFDCSLGKSKRYIAIFDFGYETDTLDATGQILSRCDSIPTANEIAKILASMIGKIQQLPPKFSAKNINGMRAYELARANIEFELKPKEIEIFDLQLIEQVSDSAFKFDITCSSGTYIRSIARDMAHMLGSLSTMTFLERVSSGNFDKSTSISLQDVLEIDDINSILITPTTAFPAFDKVYIDNQDYIDLKNGKKLNRIIDKDAFVMLNDQVVGVANKGQKLSLDIFLGE